jgi:hypothetical protein
MVNLSIPNLPEIKTSIHRKKNMHAIEFVAEIDQNHQIYLQLPETIKTGKWAYRVNQFSKHQSLG